MPDILEQLQIFLRGLQRHRWVVLGLAWPICVFGWVFVFNLPDEYESSARVQVDAQSMLRPALQGIAFDVDAGARISLVTRTLLSRPNVEKIARKSDLDLEAQDDRAFDFLIARLQRSIKLNGGRREDIYGISYSDRDATIARDVVQASLDVFMENALGQTKGGTYSAKQFLDKQIDDYEQRLLKAEKELKDFKRTNVGLMPSDRGDYYQRLQVVKAELDGAKLELRQAEQRRDSLQRQLRGEEPTFGLGPRYSLPATPESGAESPTGFGLGTAWSVEARVQNLEQNLDELLLRYTERHPEVIAVREALARIRQQRDRELSERVSSNSDSTEDLPLGPLEANPVYQHLKIALGQEELNIVALQVRVAEFDQRYQELEGFVNSVPEVEARLASLNRDYDVTKVNYQQLLSRRESVRLSQEADATNDEFRFKIIDPPRIPAKPSGPNRLLMYTGTLIFGLGAGSALAVGISLLWPTFDTSKRSIDSLGLPVLGTVKMVLSRAARQRVRLRNAAYVALGGLLVTSYSGLVLHATGAFNLPGTT